MSRFDEIDTLEQESIELTELENDMIVRRLERAEMEEECSCDIDISTCVIHGVTREDLL